MRLPALFYALFALLITATAADARAQLQIEITQGVDNPTPIAVVPFAWVGSGNPPRTWRRLSIQIWHAVDSSHPSPAATC
jgi:Tol biopolymer transport system component